MIWKIIGGIIILGLIVGGFFYWRSSQQAEPSGVSIVKEEDEAEKKPTPTEVEVDKSEFKIEVQNGSGIEGEAGRAQKLLEDNDFNVTGTANADNYDYEETVIKAGSDVPDEWIDLLVKALEDKYTVDASVEDLDSSDADVVVIVGTFDEKGESMVPEEEESTETSEDTSESTETTEETDPTETPSPSPTP